MACRSKLGTIYKWVREYVLQGSPHDLRVGRRGRMVVVLFHRGVGRVVLFPVEHRMLPGKGGVVGVMAIAYCTCRDHHNYQLSYLVTCKFSGKFVLGKNRCSFRRTDRRMGRYCRVSSSAARVPFAASSRRRRRRKRELVAAGEPPVAAGRAARWTWSPSRGRGPGTASSASRCPSSPCPRCVGICKVG